MEEMLSHLLPRSRSVGFPTEIRFAALLGAEHTLRARGST